MRKPLALFIPYQTNNYLIYITCRLIWEGRHNKIYMSSAPPNPKQQLPRVFAELGLSLILMAKTKAKVNV
ncbi:MAG: hypothetical protein ACJAUT_000139 [Cellvibrionaceae bacterium]|jgi:hypothetical protein